MKSSVASIGKRYSFGKNHSFPSVTERFLLVWNIPNPHQPRSCQATKKISFSFPNKFQLKKQSSCKQALSLAWQPSWLRPHNSVGFPPALQFLQISIEALRRKTFAKKRPMLCSSFQLFPAETAKDKPVMSKTPLYEQSIRREVFSICVHTVCPNKSKKPLCTEEVGRILPYRLSEP